MHGDRHASADFALLRNVRPAADPRARRAAAAECSHKNRIQAGEVRHRSESLARAGAGRLLGRPGLLLVLRTLRTGMATQVVEIENTKTGRPVEAVYEHRLAVRLCHWLNAVSLFVMIGSGLQIFCAYRIRGLEADPVFLAGLADGRISPRPAVALPGDVGHQLFHRGTPRDGGAAWLEQSCFHAHGLEVGHGISGTIAGRTDQRTS